MKNTQSQISLPFNLINRNKTVVQPQFFKSLNEIIKIEENIQTLERSSWDDKYDFYQNNDISEDFIIIDHINKNIIIFLNQLGKNPKNLSIGTQIIYHWLYGETIGTENSSRTKKLTTQELSLFFKGSQNDIMEFQRENHVVGAAQSLNWQLYHYSSKYFNGNNIIGEYIEKYFGEIFKKYQKYDTRFAYGIVSKQNHIRSNKRELKEFIEIFLDERGFDVSDPYEVNDFSRNGEPILLWINKNYIDGVEFKAAVGMNFGYDNGLSSFRLALGLYLENEKVFIPQINNVAFRQYYYDEKFQQSMNFVFKRWIHHKSFDRIEDVAKVFFEKHYTRIFDNISSIVALSKDHKYDNETSKKILKNTHKREFKKYTDELMRFHNKRLNGEGPSRYTHFLAWNDLAESIQNNKSIKSLAEFIAVCILGRK